LTSRSDPACSVGDAGCVAYGIPHDHFGGYTEVLE
jgi:hypothetical protein